jgi:hypothetical protein
LPEADPLDTLPIRRRQRSHLLIAQLAISIEDVIALKADVDLVDHLPSPDREDGDRGRVPETRSDPLTEPGHGDPLGSVLLALQVATFAPTDRKPGTYPQVIENKRVFLFLRMEFCESLMHKMRQYASRLV